MDHEAVLSDSPTGVKTAEANAPAVSLGARLMPRFLRDMGNGFNAWLNRPISWPPFLAERSPSSRPAKVRKTSEAAPDACAAAEVAVPVRDFIIDQTLWGGGFLGPAGKRRTLDLATPLALTPASNFLLVGAGAGGAARAVTDKFGCWVDALEIDPEIGDLAAATVKKLGLEKVRVQMVDSSAPGLTENRYDSILSMEAFWSVREKTELLVAVAQSLKSGGSFHLTDYVGSTRGDSASEGWTDSDGGAVELWAESAIRECLTELGLRVRIEEDATEDHIHEVLAMWQSFSNAIKPASLTPERTAYLFALGRCWDARIDALQKGEVKLQRVFAIKA